MAASTRWTAPGRLFVAPDRGPFSPLRFHRQREPLQAMAFWKKQRERICVQCSANGKRTGISRQVRTDKIGEKWRKRMGGKRNCEKIDKGLYKRYSKGENRYSLLYKFAVAPCAGAGIEISILGYFFPVHQVAPCAGAGIEIVPFKLTNATSYVVPRAGAGIEIISTRRSCGG